MKGRKPKPTHLKLVEGNRGKRSLNKNEPKPAAGIPNPPEHLSDGAKLAWGALSVKLDEMRVLTYADAWALEQLAENYAEILEIRRLLSAGKRLLVKTMTNGARMVITNPLVFQLSDAEKRFKAMMVEFGLTPSSRSRVHANPKDEKEDDPAAKYFG